MNKKNDDWDFSKVNVDVKKESTTTKVVLSTGPKKSPKLELDTSSVPKNKTRTQMYNEMAINDVKDEGDVFTYASFIKRGIALIFDSFFMAMLVYISFMAAPLYQNVINGFLDKYNLRLHFSETIAIQIAIVFMAFLLVFFLVIIPLAFYNHSFGKKILNLKLRGDEKFTLSIAQVIKRELIFKPVSIVLLAGFIMPFFSKHKQSLHDFLAHTIVIEDD